MPACEMQSSVVSYDADGDDPPVLMMLYLFVQTWVKHDFSFPQNEIFASRHQDVNSVACIEDKCYVQTLAQYCR